MERGLSWVGKLQALADNFVVTTFLSQSPKGKIPRNTPGTARAVRKVTTSFRSQNHLRAHLNQRGEKLPNKQDLDLADRPSWNSGKVAEQAQTSFRLSHNSDPHLLGYLVWGSD